MADDRRLSIGLFLPNLIMFFCKHKHVCVNKNSSAKNMLSLIHMGFPFGSAGKESACKAGELGLIPGLGRFPCRRKVFWPGEYHSMNSPWDCRVEDD